eukprot:6455302-Amphidinium_carterae.1
MDQSRIWAGASLLRRIVFTRQASRAFKQGHNYWKLTLEEAIDELVTLRSDPTLSEDGRLQIVNERLHARFAAEPQTDHFVHDAHGDHVVMVSLAPSSSPAEHDIQLDMTADIEDEDPIPEWALPQNIDYDDPIPTWALPNHVVGNEIPLRQSFGL